MEITLINSETGEEKVVLVSTKDILVDRELVWFDGKCWLFSDCPSFNEVINDNEPWIEAEDCENCLEEAEDSNIEYERNMTWKDGGWVCDGCGHSQ